MPKWRYALIARHDEMGTERIMSWHDSLEAARLAVSHHERDDTWPSGHEAYLREIKEEWVMNEFGGWVRT